MQSSHSSLSSRKELEKRLAFHLGVEDGTGDVLDYLLTMESKEVGALETISLVFVFNQFSAYFHVCALIAHRMWRVIILLR
jgi:hypothetical protein